MFENEGNRINWVGPSSIVWVEVELSWGRAGVEIVLRLSLASILTLQLKSDYGLWKKSIKEIYKHLICSQQDYIKRSQKTVVKDG